MGHRFWVPLHYAIRDSVCSILALMANGVHVTTIEGHFLSVGPWHILLAKRRMARASCIGRNLRFRENVFQALAVTLCCRIIAKAPPSLELLSAITHTLIFEN